MIAVIEGGELYHVRTDHIGRPVFATNDLGVKVWEVSYLPFGGVRQVLSGAPIDLRFPGQWFQSESGLHQNWMRDYDPTTGRYIQADPLGLVDGASVYGYALQNPGRFTDPTGEFIPAIAIGIGIGAGAAFLGELWRHDGRWECINWATVGIGGALGAFGGAWVGAWKAGLTGARGMTAMSWKNASSAYKSATGVSSTNISHHAIVRALKGHPNGWRNAWWNMRALSPARHNALHGQFGAAKMGTFGRWWYGTPHWLLGAEASMIGGTIAEGFDG